ATAVGCRAVNPFKGGNVHTGRHARLTRAARPERRYMQPLWPVRSGGGRWESNPHKLESQSSALTIGLRPPQWGVRYAVQRGRSSSTPPRRRDPHPNTTRLSYLN